MRFRVIRISIKGRPRNSFWTRIRWSPDFEGQYSQIRTSRVLVESPLPVAFAFYKKLFNGKETVGCNLVNLKVLLVFGVAAMLGTSAIPAAGKALRVCADPD